MAFDNSLPPSAFAPGGGSNFLKPSGTDFVFDADGDWMNAMGRWETFWRSTFAPNSYKKKRDKEIEDALVDKYKVDDGMSCKKINDRIDDMEDFYDSEAGASGRGRGGTRMQARNLAGIEKPLNKAYDLAEDKCCEFSVCASNKDRGRDSGDTLTDEVEDQVVASSDSSGGMTDEFRNQLMQVLQQRTVSQPEETPMSTKIGLGVGALVILGGMGYLIFGK